MDFYANSSLGPWTVNNEQNRPAAVTRRRKNIHVHTEKLPPEMTALENLALKSNPETRKDCDGQNTECCGKCHQDALKQSEVKTVAS